MRTLGGMAAQGRCPPRKWPGTRGNGYPAFSLPIPKFSPLRYNYERSASLAAALRVLVESQLAKRVAEGGHLAERVDHPHPGTAGNVLMTTTPADTRARLEELLAERILLLDGSMGALIFSRGPTEEDYRGDVFRRHPVPLRNCTEGMVLSQPRLIEDIHRAYLEAGSDILETCTFNANALSLAEFELQDRVHELNARAAELARRAADDFTQRAPRKPRFVAGSIGPTNKQLSVGIGHDPSHRDVTFDQMVNVYYEQVRGLVDGGVDILLPETAFDTLVQKACLFAIAKYFDDTGRRLPVMISGTIFDSGRTLTGQSVEAYY